MANFDISAGCKVYAKTVYIEQNGITLSYNAPRGKKFALILMGAEKPSAEGLNPNEWLNSCGWKLEQEN